MTYFIGEAQKNRHSIHSTSQEIEIEGLEVMLEITPHIVRFQEYRETWAN